MVLGIILICILLYAINENIRINNNKTYKK